MSSSRFSQLAIIDCPQRRKDFVRASDLSRTLITNAFWNANTTINRLPLELILEIFRYVQSPGSYDWLSITEVCRHWFVVAATSPQLWCGLVVRGNINFMETGLFRSKNCAVDVRVEGMRALVLSLLIVLPPHVHRLRSVFIRTSDSRQASIFADCIRWLSMPMLQSVEVVFTSSHAEMEDDTLVLALDTLPALRQLVIKGLTPIFTISMLRELTVLHLSQFSLHSSHFGPYLSPPGIMIDTLTRPHFAVIVRNCINVQRLVLSDIWAGVTNPVPPIRQERVMLSRLSYLELKLEAHIMRLILSNIAVPSTADVSLHRSVEDGIPRAGLASGLCAMLPVDWIAAIPAFSSITTATVSMHAGKYQLLDSIPSHTFSEGDTSRGGSLSLSMTIPPSARFGANDVLRILCVVPLTDLRLQPNDDRMESFPWRDILGQLRHLRSLSLEGVGGAASGSWTSILSSLAPAHSGSSVREENRMVCPDLEDLHFKGFTLHALIGSRHQIVRLLRERKEYLGKELALQTFGLEVTEWDDWGYGLARDQKRRMVTELSALVGTML